MPREVQLELPFTKGKGQGAGNETVPEGGAVTDERTGWRCNHCNHFESLLFDLVTRVSGYIKFGG